MSQATEATCDEPGQAGGVELWGAPDALSLTMAQPVHEGTEAAAPHPRGLPDSLVAVTEKVAHEGYQGRHGIDVGGTSGRQAIDKLEETRKHVIREEEDIRALHAALLAEQKKLVAEEAALLQNGNMESYVETVEQILDMRAALDAQLRDHIATYKQLLLDEEMSTKQLADLVWA
eukprot:gene3612-4542_t